MSWRDVLVSNPARLSLKNTGLLIKQEEEILVPLEDISSIVVESEQVTITSKLLNEIAGHGIAFYVCDPKHMPSGLFLSFQQHSRFVKTLRTQMSLTEAFRKNCWRMKEAEVLEDYSFLRFAGRKKRRPGSIRKVPQVST